MKALELALIKIDSMSRRFVTGLSQSLNTHTRPMDDSTALMAIHVQADEIDETYYKRLRENIRLAEENGRANASYQIYLNCLSEGRKEIEHPGYSEIKR